MLTSSVWRDGPVTRFNKLGMVALLLPAALSLAALLVGCSNGGDDTDITYGGRMVADASTGRVDSPVPVDSPDPMPMPDSMPTAPAPDVPPMIDRMGEPPFRTNGGCPPQNISWCLVNSVGSLGRDRIRGILARAFTTWSSLSRFTFAEAACTSAPMIRLSFEGRDHNSDFGTAGGLLAHADWPVDGRPGEVVHFDSAENWGDTPGTTDLETVAVHEIGHCLGLAHSEVAEACMYAFYSGRRRDLRDDDVAGITDISNRCIEESPPPCGGNGESCCAGSACGAGLTCQAGICRTRACTDAGPYTGSGSGGGSGARCLATYSVPVIAGRTYQISTCGSYSGDPYVVVSGACNCRNDDSCGHGSSCTCTATTTGTATVCASSYGTSAASWNYRVDDTSCGAPPCGGSGESCCAGSACSAGLTCQSGVCRTPPACTDAGPFSASGTGGGSGERCLATYSVPVIAGRTYEISTCGSYSGDPYVVVSGACNCRNDDSCGLGSSCTCTATTTGTATICASSYSTSAASWNHRVDDTSCGTPPCGGSGESCCTGGACGAGLTCQAGVCLTPACTDAGPFSASGSGGGSGARCLATYSVPVIAGRTYQISTCGSYSGDPYVVVSGACSCRNDDSCGLGAACTCTATTTGTATICASSYSTSPASWNYRVDDTSCGH